MNLNIHFKIEEGGSGEISVSDKFADRANAFIFLHSNREVLSDLEPVHGLRMSEVIRVQGWKVKRENSGKNKEVGRKPLVA